MAPVLAPIEQAVEPGERIPLGFVSGVGVDLQGRADPGVPEDGLGVASRDAKVLQQRGDRVPDVMDLDQPDVVVIADASERPDEVARLHRTAGPGGEDEAGALPG